MGTFVSAIGCFGDSSLQSRDLSRVAEEARAQVDVGVDIFDVNVGVSGVEEATLLPEVLQLVMETVDVPLCIDSNHPKVLRAGLETYKGKALINSVSGQKDLHGGGFPRLPQRVVLCQWLALYI